MLQTPQLSVRIRSTGMYHPQERFDNEYFIDFFMERDNNDITRLLEHLGKETRYLSRNNPDENSLTMAQSAAEQALERSGLQPSDIQMIMFISDTPEYTYPTNAVMLHERLNTPNAHLVYDMNANCIGAISALDQASIMMKAKGIKYALIAGGVSVSKAASDKEPIMFSAFADGGGALILELGETDEAQTGFVDADFYTESIITDIALYPNVGHSRMLDASIPESEKRIYHKEVDVSFFSAKWKGLITGLLSKHGLEPGDVDHFIFSQLSLAENLKTLDLLGVDHGKQIYVGDKYGYTGVTGPIFALNEALQSNRIKPGDKLVICSVGLGYVMGACLYRF